MNQNPSGLPTQPYAKPKLTFGKIFGLFSGTLLAVALLCAIFFRQDILDQVVVWQHPLSADLASIANRAGMNKTGEFYLAASQTAIVDREKFNSDCSSLINEKTVILGCYDPTDRRIYVYNVTDKKLDGIREATTAHEMLHAAYDRLSPWDKQRINSLLEAERAKVTDQRIKDLIASYEQSEPTEVVNELHSICGTEVSTLSPELEQYYNRYFSDRHKVITLKDTYEKVFTDLSNQQTALVTKLNAMAPSLKTRVDQYEKDLDAYNTDVDAFNTWADSSSVTMTEFYNRRGGLVSRGDRLESDRTSINNDVETYNSLKDQLDAINLQAKNLNQSIDSKKIPSPNAL